jgi:hypothetical protein
MGEKDQTPQGSATTDAGKYKKPSIEDEQKPYHGRRNNQDRHGSNRKRATPSTHVPKEKCVGRSDGLKGFTYNVTSNKGEVFYTRTTKEIARYVRKIYTTTGSFIRAAILTLTVPT